MTALLSNILPMAALRETQAKEKMESESSRDAKALSTSLKTPPSAVARDQKVSSTLPGTFAVTMRGSVLCVPLGKFPRAVPGELL